MGFYEVFGGFAPNGTSDPDPTASVGIVESFTVTRTGVGVFLMAILDTHVQVVSMQLGLMDGDGSSPMTTLQVGTVDLVSTPKTYELKVFDPTGTAVDLAAVTNRLITFDLLLQY